MEERKCERESCGVTVNWREREHERILEEKREAAENIYCIVYSVYGTTKQKVGNRTQYSFTFKANTSVGMCCRLVCVCVYRTVNLFQLSLTTKVVV